MTERRTTPLLVLAARRRPRPRRSPGPGRAIALALICAWALAASVQAQQSSAVVHTWKRVFYGVLDGVDALLFVDRMERGKAALGDIDGDGDLDLLAGFADGRVAVFENSGTAKQPKWRLVNDGLRALRSSQEKPDGPQGDAPILVGENAAPALVDIDGDGDLDLFVGAASGQLHFFRNEGNPYLPLFASLSTSFLGASFGGNLVPRFADLNADGAPDLLLGNERGEVYSLMNQGTRFAPSFCLNATDPVPSCPAPPEPLVRLAGADNAAPEPVDWDGDGDVDLMVGKSDGRIAYYRNLGTKTAPAWELAEERFNILDAGGYAAPLFRDVNGDGRPDLMLWGDNEFVQFYRNQAGSGPFPLFLEDRNLFQVKRLGRFDRRVQVAAGDLNADGVPDLIVGSGSGALYQYFGTGKGEPAGFRSVPEPLLPSPKRAFAAPALADIDGDGDLDLIVGDRNGRLELIRNAGTPQAPQWRAEDVFFARVDVGSLSSPSFLDVDGDGDLDLIVGNSLGNVVLFENRGDKAKPDFALVSVRFGNLRLPGHATPAAFAWNPKGPPDLVSGATDGNLYSAVRNQAVKASAGNAWLPENQPWSGIHVGSYSAPQFADFSGDGRPDLIAGTGEGALALWRYEGSVPREQLARAGQAPGRNLVPDGGGFVLEDGQAAQPAGLAPNDLEARAGMRLLQPREFPLDPIFVEESNSLTALSAGRNTVPVFADLNGDGLPDLLVGNAQGQLHFFRNRGPRVAPVWEKVTEKFAGYDGGRNAAPALADLDGDGDLDLIVGNEAGQVRLWENAGSAQKPEYRARPDALRGIQVGNNAVPVFVDLDGDGKPELLVGNLKGALYFYRRKPGAALDYELVDRRFAGLNAGISASPHVADLNNDRAAELLIGSDLGKIYVFQRTATSPLYSSGWKRQDAFLEGLKFSPGSHPAIADLDGDGDADLLSGSDKGPLRFFRNNVLVPETKEGTAAQQ